MFNFGHKQNDLIRTPNWGRHIASVAMLEHISDLYNYRAQNSVTSIVTLPNWSQHSHNFERMKWCYLMLCYIVRFYRITLRYVRLCYIMSYCMLFVLPQFKITSNRSRMIPNWMQLNFQSTANYCNLTSNWCELYHNCNEHNAKYASKWFLNCSKCVIVQRIDDLAFCALIRFIWASRHLQGLKQGKQPTETKIANKKFVRENEKKWSPTGRLLEHDNERKSTT